MCCWSFTYIPVDAETCTATVIGHKCGLYVSKTCKSAAFLLNSSTFVIQLDEAETQSLAPYFD